MRFVEVRTDDGLPALVRYDQILSVAPRQVVDRANKPTGETSGITVVLISGVTFLAAEPSYGDFCDLVAGELEVME